MCHTYQVPVFIPTAILKDRYFCRLCNTEEERGMTQVTSQQVAAGPNLPLSQLPAVSWDSLSGGASMRLA